MYEFIDIIFEIFQLFFQSETGLCAQIHLVIIFTLFLICSFCVWTFHIKKKKSDSNCKQRSESEAKVKNTTVKINRSNNVECNITGNSNTTYKNNELNFYINYLLDSNMNNQTATIINEAEIIAILKDYLAMQANICNAEKDNTNTNVNGLSSTSLQKRVFIVYMIDDTCLYMVDNILNNSLRAQKNGPCKKEEES